MPARLAIGRAYAGVMPSVYAFPAIQYAGPRDLSSVVAPPYDVLDETSKRAMLDRDADNIVGIDLPHTPPKELGPAAAYEQAADAFTRMLASGRLVRSPMPVMFAYRQSFAAADGRATVRRSGMACCLETVKFGPRAGGGILPHEETFSGPKEDRLALMRATKAQLSPIFGLHADERGLASSLLAKVIGQRPATREARTTDGTLHEIWEVADAQTIKEYQSALADEDVFIADGHHRYNTGLNYLGELEFASGGEGALSADHPARRSMFVLVGMSDPGLVIWPTHRVFGGMANYSREALLLALKPHFRLTPVAGDLRALESEVSRTGANRPRLGLCDLQSRSCFLAEPTTADPLAPLFPGRHRAWRTLEVSIIQHILVDQVLRPSLNGGGDIRWAFPHTVREIEHVLANWQNSAAGAGASGSAQLAAIVPPTPLQAVKEVSRAGQLMPQKSTFFYPKLATGLFINPLH